MTLILIGVIERVNPYAYQGNIYNSGISGNTVWCESNVFPQKKYTEIHKRDDFREGPFSELNWSGYMHCICWCNRSDMGINGYILCGNR